MLRLQEHALVLLRVLSADELIEPALVTFGGLIFDDQRELLLFELLEPLLPGDAFEGLFATVPWEIDADHPNVVLITGACDVGRKATTRFSPLSDVFMISHNIAFGPLGCCCTCLALSPSHMRQSMKTLDIERLALLPRLHLALDCFDQRLTMLVLFLIVLDLLDFTARKRAKLIGNLIDREVLIMLDWEMLI